MTMSSGFLEQAEAVAGDPGHGLRRHHGVAEHGCCPRSTQGNSYIAQNFRLAHLGRIVTCFSNTRAKIADCIPGCNGAGKTTTIRLLLNFIFPTRGRARIFGMDCVEKSREIKRQVGYLPGEVGYYGDMRVKDLLAYSERFYGKDCSGRGRELAEALDLDLEARIENLSLGNKKKVGIAQALLHSPRLLILDEPTGGLDPLIQKRFFDLLGAENRRGVTIFFSSHVLSEVQKFCHRVGIIKEGRILRVGDIERLRGQQLSSSPSATWDSSVRCS